MKVLVTGGAGYIGSHVAKSLYENGYEPIVYDNFSTGNSWAVKWGPEINGDVRDFDLLVKTINSFNVSAIVHLAAKSNSRESFEKPNEYFDVNINGTKSILNAMVTTGVKKLIFSSSCSVFGTPVRVPSSEEEITDPISPYGESKFICERLIYWYGMIYNINYVIFRYFNVAGADPNLEIGESHSPETHIIPILIQSAIEGKTVNIYGSNHPTVDGSTVRDFIHVSDVSDAHLKVLDKIMFGWKNSLYHLGSETGYSLFDIISKIQILTGKKIKIKMKSKNPGDPPALISDISKAKKELNWKPKHKIDSILDTALKWFLKNQ